jgi:Carbon-nitrogen hydrolase
LQLTTQDFFEEEMVNHSASYDKNHSRIVRAAAVQISPVLFSRDGTTEKVLSAIAKAAQEGVQLIVFPETFVPYYPYFSFIQPPVLMGKEHLRLYEEAVEVPSAIAPYDRCAGRERAREWFALQYATHF